MNSTFRSLRPYMRGLPLIAIAMVVAVMCARKYVTYITPMYESAVKIKLADINEGVPSSNLFKDLDVFANKNKITAEIELLKSEVLISKVISEMNSKIEISRVGKIRSVVLYNQSPILVTIANPTSQAYDKKINLYLKEDQSFTIQLHGKTESLGGKIGDTLSTAYGDILITLNDSLIKSHQGIKIEDHYLFELQSPDKLLKNVSKNLDITAVDKDVAVIRISYKDVNPEKSADLVNHLAEAYITDYIDTKYKTAKLTVNFLEDQINGVIEKLTDAENQIQEYRETEGITNLTQETETDLRKISQLKIQQTNLKMNLQAIEELEKYMAEGKNNFLELAPNFEAFTDLLSTEMIKKIKQLQSEKKDLMLVYTPEDEKVKVIDQKIKDVTDYMQESIRNTKTNYEIKYNNITEDIEEAELVFVDVPEKQKILTILNREFNIYESTYNFLNEKKIEAEIAQAAKVAFHRIISHAETPEAPVSPNKTIIIVISALMALFGSIMLIFLFHSAKGKVNDVQEIESNSNIPIAILTPKLWTAQKAQQHFLKEINQLDIKGLLPPQGVVCISGFRKTEGSAYNALQLAEAAAFQNRKVILIDVDNQLGYSRNNQTEPTTRPSGLDITPLELGNRSQLVPSQIQQFLQALKSKYDLIILLNENLDQGHLATVMMNAAQLNLLVVDCRLTSRKKIPYLQLLQLEYNFPQPHFLLNRNNYNPNVFADIYRLFKSIYAKINRIKRS